MEKFEQVFTVGQLTMLVGEAVALLPAGLVVEGEIQKVRVYKDFMVFFELSGQGQSINCFTTFLELKGEAPQEGEKVQVVGEISLGKKTELRFKVREFRSAGSVGESARKLEELKLKLRKEGAFDDSRKKELPRFPKRVAVVTSGSSSAWEDFKRVSSSRFLASEVVLFNSTVQGDSAVQEICSNLARILEKETDFDVVAIIRGGGARGDLEAFNSEEIVRAILKLSIPVVSGVGHEDDISLVDLVADRRASTPSNAAEVIFPDSKDLLKEILRLEQRASSGVLYKIANLEDELAGKAQNLNRAIDSLVFRLESKFNVLSARLSGLDFEKIFAKGFALLEKDGKPVKSVGSLALGDFVEATLSDGRLGLEVKSKS
jgi:exodeoxyribonuclease VII large subunit